MSGSSSSTAWDLIPILHASHQVVLYNPTSHALSIRERVASEVNPSTKPLSCPYCERPYDTDAPHGHRRNLEEGLESRVPNYFQLLAVANESSRPSTPFMRTRPVDSEASGIGSDTMAEGYFSAFFKEECRLGMGANGSVFLCQHVLDGNLLGRFAVKKIAVGQSHDYLLKSLREVRLLETLRHPNIINYHHAWLETCRFSSFGPSVPTLFVLMQWAEGGSLDDFINARLGFPSSRPHGSYSSTAAEEETQSRSSRIRTFRAAQAHPEETRARRREKRNAERGRAVHLLSAEEVKNLFNDVVSGLGFLHARSILHLDLKPGNVLLTLDEGSLIPRAMLSDFGTYQDMVRPERARTGVTGTLEYTAPESLSLSNQPSSKADMWSLGMILHMLLFFRLPYDHVEDNDISRLEEEVRTYSGFKSTSDVFAACRRRGLPRAAMILLEELLTVIPRARPSCEQILAVLKEGKLDPLRDSPMDEDRGSLIPVVRSRRDSLSLIPAETRGDADETVRNRRSSDAVTVEPDSLSHEKALSSPVAPPPRPVFRPFWGLRWLTPLFTRFHAGLLVKSTLLISKVLSLTTLCNNSPPRTSVLCLILAMAVVDTWHDSVVGSLFLGACHLGILGFGKRRCCTF